MRIYIFIYFGVQPARRKMRGQDLVVHHIMHMRRNKTTPSLPRDMRLATHAKPCSTCAPIHNTQRDFFMTTYWSEST